MTLGEHLNRFVLEMKALDPELSQMLNISEGLIYIQLSDLAEWCQKAIDEGDFASFADGVNLVEKYMILEDDMPEEFFNAVVVAFLEHLSFLGPHGFPAWQRMPAKLSQMHEYFLGGVMQTEQNT